MTTDDQDTSLARLRTDLEITRAVLAQTQRALEAERAARERAEAINVVLRQTIQTCGRDASNSYIRHLCKGMLRSENVGVPLLAELEAARAYLAYVFETYPPTSAIEMALRAAYDVAREG